MTVSEVAYPRPWGQRGPVWVGEAGLLSRQPLKSLCGRLVKEVCAFSPTPSGEAPRSHSHSRGSVRLGPSALLLACCWSGSVQAPSSKCVHRHTGPHVCTRTDTHTPRPPSTQTQFTITVWGGSLVWAGWAGGGGREGGWRSGEVCARVWHLGWGW